MASGSVQSTTYTEVAIGTITFGAGGYVDISSFIPSGISPVLTGIVNFGSTSGAISITLDGKYALGAPNTTTTNVKVRYYYHG